MNKNPIVINICCLHPPWPYELKVISQENLINNIQGALFCRKVLNIVVVLYHSTKYYHLISQHFIKDSNNNKTKQNFYRAEQTFQVTIIR